MISDMRHIHSLPEQTSSTMPYFHAVPTHCTSTNCKLSYTPDQFTPSCIALSWPQQTQIRS